MGIKVNKLSVHYENTRSQTELVAVKNLNFEVDSGQFVVILGPSGCGKTSTLNAIAGLITPHAGSVSINGKLVTGPREKSAVVFQSPALMPWRTILGNVYYALELKGVSRKIAKNQAEKYLDMVGIVEFSDRYPHELSGGMQQRANLARALTVEADTLIFDEPLSALDSPTRARLQVEIQHIVHQSGATAIYVTHDVREAIVLADKIIVMTKPLGCIKEIVSVDIPRIRTNETLSHPLFIDIEQHVWSLIHDEQQ